MLDLKPIHIPYDIPYESNTAVTNNSLDIVWYWLKRYLYSLDWDVFIESGTAILGVFGMLTYADEVDTYYEKKMSDFLDPNVVFEFPDEIMIICMGSVGSAIGGVAGVLLSGLMSLATGKSSGEDMTSWVGDLSGSAASTVVMSLTLLTSLEIFMHRLQALHKENKRNLLYLTQKELVAMWREGLGIAWGFGGLATSVGSAMYLRSMVVESE